MKLSNDIQDILMLSVCWRNISLQVMYFDDISLLYRCVYRKLEIPMNTQFVCK